MFWGHLCWLWTVFAACRGAWLGRAWPRGRGGGAALPLAGGGRGVAAGVAGQEFPTMPRCSAAADGCCAVALPFAAAAARSAPRGPGSCGPPAAAAPQRLQPPAGPPLPPPPPPARPRCPAAMNPPAAAGGEETGAAGGGGCRGAEGGGEAAGAAGIPEEQELSAADESLEEKLRSLTFRKQVSYRWVPGGRAPLGGWGGGRRVWRWCGRAAA